MCSTGKTYLLSTRTEHSDNDDSDDNHDDGWILRKYMELVIRTLFSLANM